MVIKPKQRQLQVIFHGGPTQLRDLKISELTKILGEFEAAMEAIAFGEDDDDGREALGIGVAELRNGSAICVFFARAWVAAVAAFTVMGTAINTGKFDQIPPRAVEAIRYLKTVSVNHEMAARFEIVDVDQDIETITVVGDLSEETRVPEKLEIHGDTRIYGRVLRVGGDKPAVRLDLGHAKFTVTVSEPMAQEIANRLYREIALEGDAVWNADTGELTKFVATRVIPFDPLPADELVTQFHARFGSAFDDVDIDEFIRARQDD